MLNKQGLFGQNERYRRDSRGLEPSAPAPAPEPQRVEPPRQEAVEVPKPKVEEPKGSRLIVGPDIKLKGAEITDCDTLVVEGRVEASMDARVIQIAEERLFPRHRRRRHRRDPRPLRRRDDRPQGADHPSGRPGRGQDPLRQDRHRGRRRADRRCRHDLRREARRGRAARSRPIQAATTSPYLPPPPPPSRGRRAPASRGVRGVDKPPLRFQRIRPFAGGTTPRPRVQSAAASPRPRAMSAAVRAHLTDLVTRALAAVAPNEPPERDRARASARSRPRRLRDQCRDATRARRSSARRASSPTLWSRRYPTSEWVDRPEIAGPGFINFRLKPAAKQGIVRTILRGRRCVRPRPTAAPAGA